MTDRNGNELFDRVVDLAITLMYESERERSNAHRSGVSELTRTECNGRCRALRGAAGYALQIVMDFAEPDERDAIIRRIDREAQQRLQQAEDRIGD